MSSPEKPLPLGMGYVTEVSFAPFDTQVHTLTLGGKRHTTRALLGGRVGAAFHDNAESFLAGLCTAHAPDRLEPPFTFQVDGRTFAHGGMGTDDRQQSAQWREQLRHFGVNDEQAFAATRTRLDERPLDQFSAVDRLFDLFAAGLHAGTFTFTPQQVLGALAPYRER